MPRLPRLILTNLLRLLTTFGIGLAMLWQFGLQGPEVQAQYLLLLGVRWVLSVPALGLEAAAVSALVRGQGQAVRRCATLVALGLIGLGLGAAFLGRPSMQALFLVSALWAGAQTLVAPGLARLLLADRPGRHAALMGLRRLADPVALAFALVWTAEGTSLFGGFLVWLTAATGVIAVLSLFMSRAPIPVLPETVARFLPIWGASTMIAASQIASLRLPVLLLGLTLPPTLALPASIAFVIGGYLRQAATVALIGLDAMVAGLSPDRQGSLAHRATVAGVVSVILVMLAVSSLLPSLLTLLLPADIDLPGTPPLTLWLVLAGVGFRVICDLWIKILSGAGRQPALVGRISLHAGLMAAIFLALPLILPAAHVPLAFAAAFAVGQALLLAPVHCALRDIRTATPPLPPDAAAPVP